jgi:hypothetical protein
MTRMAGTPAARDSAIVRRPYAPWQVGRLDRALAAGADPLDSTALGARARALCDPGMREMLASAIYGLLEQASRRPGIWTLVARRAVQRNRAELLALAAALRQAPVVAPRGVAATRLLVTNGGGPLYNEDESGELEVAVGSARAWLGDEL